jgi:class 3 adenylate cyclase
VGLSDDLNAEVKKILADRWKESDGRVVPEAESLLLTNEAVKLEGTVLYADLAESTQLVNTKTPQFSAEIYKTFLHCAAKVVHATSGTVTAYDGDRVMAVYLGDARSTNAADAALKINHAVVKIINPLVKEQYPKLDAGFKMSHCVGIDTSSLFVARTGVRGANDLVWVGRAANYAAKLCALRQDPYFSWMTEEAFNGVDNSLKYTNGKAMWEKRTWRTYDIPVYCCSWIKAP